MDVLVVHGGSFMTTDPSARSIRLRSVKAAIAQLRWIAQSTAGEQRNGRLFVSIRPDTPRLPALVDLGIRDGVVIALTALQASEQ